MLRWIRRYVTISYLALAGYIVYPDGAAVDGRPDGLLPPLARISSRGFHDLGIERTTMVFGGLPNKTAAMPSLHCGFTFLSRSTRSPACAGGGAGCCSSTQWRWR